jgi:hypothetical protein
MVVGGEILSKPLFMRATTPTWIIASAHKRQRGQLLQASRAVLFLIPRLPQVDLRDLRR